MSQYQNNQEFLQDAGAEIFVDEMKARRERRREFERQAARQDLAQKFFNLVAEATAHIKTCPFCGTIGRYTRNGRTHWIACPNTDCPVQPYVQMDLANTVIGELVTAWNTRVLDSAESH